MARETYVMRNGELVPKRLAPPLHAPHGSGPSVISDTLDGLWAPFDGKRYDSKSAYFGEARRRGLECVGNEDIGRHLGERPQATDREVVEAIKKSVSELGGGW